MTLLDLLEYFRASFVWQDGIYTGKRDKDKEKAVCFYNSRLRQQKTATVGGKANRSYDLRPVSILLRWTQSSVQAEAKAQEIYDFFDELAFTHQGRRIFCVTTYDRPMDLGTDEKGIFEYSIEMDVYATK